MDKNQFEEGNDTKTSDTIVNSIMKWNKGSGVL